MMENWNMNITVYLGSNEGNDQAFKTAVRELGTWIGRNGHSLVYGGSKCGLMGELAESVLKAGGHVTGVEPKFFIDMGFDYPDISELVITENMRDRKEKMIELGDAFIAFPGGTGTLEEISEIIARVCLGKMSSPCIIYNLSGYYDTLKELLSNMINKGLSTYERQRGIYFASDINEIAEIIKTAGK